MDWISSKLQANGTIVWSHGYRSAPIEGDCKVDTVVYEDPYQPTCKVDINSWEGAYSFAYKTGGKPDKIEDVELFKRIGPTKWCVHGTTSGYNCATWDGAKFVTEKHGGITGTLTATGDIEWGHGYTTRLFDPCRVESCTATFEDMDKMSYRTFYGWDAHQKTTDNFELHRVSHDKWCTAGDVSGRNCFYRRGNVLTHNKHKWMKGRLQPDGDIIWSYGSTSRAEQNPCMECKVTLKDFIGQKTESWKSDDPSEKIVDNWTVYEKGDMWW